jgi:hypothetical protein
MFEKQLVIYRYKRKRVKGIGQAVSTMNGGKEAWSPLALMGAEGTSKGICTRNTLLIGLIQNNFVFLFLDKY